MKKDPRLEQAELLISRVLRYGVMLCCGVIAIGVAVHLARPDLATGISAAALDGLTRAGEADLALVPHSLADVRTGIQAFQPDAIMSLGLILLIALPIARVALTVLVFLIERDWAFFFITLIVLTILMTGIVFGKAI